MITNGKFERTDSSAKVRIAWPDAAKGLAIILVVLHHSIGWAETAGLTGEGWTDFSEALRTMRMPLFFACAGLFAGKWITQVPWRPFLVNKVGLLLWVYVLWLVIRTLWFIVFGNTELSALLDLPMAILLPYEGWFLYILAVFFIVSKVTRRVPIPIRLAVAGMLSVASLAGWLWFDNVGWDGAASFYFFFLIGTIFSRRIIAGADRISAVGAWAMFFAWVAAATIATLLGALDLPVVGFILRAIGLAGGIALATRLAWWTWLKRVGQATLPIYVAHIMVVAVFVRLLEYSDLDVLNVVSPIIVLILSLVACRVLTLAVARFGPHWLFELPRPLVYRPHARQNVEL